MAKLYTKGNRIKRSWKLCSRISATTLRFGYIILRSMLAKACFSLHYKKFMLLYALIPAFLLSVVCYLISILTAKQAAVLSAGGVGEKATRQLVRHLPGAYTAVSNVKITHEGNTSELDMVVVGPTGVFVIETKNYTGHITGRADDNSWRRVKRSESGHNYSSTFYSPVKQVSTHAYRLSKVLKQSHLFVWVQGIVYFDASVSLKIAGNTQKIPIFRSDTKTPPKYNRLLSYIRNFPIQKRLSPKTVDRIVRYLRA